MQLRGVWIPVLAAVFVSQGIAAANSEWTPPPHLGVAQALVTSLKGVSDNHYGGGPRHISWDPEHPSARAVCSSFASLLLEHTYRLKGRDIGRMGAGVNPKAEDYFAAAQAGRGFSVIDRFHELKPGDFLFVKYTDGHVNANGVENTGHVMLIADAPKLTQVRGEAPSDCDVYTVRVIDSTSTGHGESDTRRIGPAKFTGGVGAGTIRIAVDRDADHIRAYSWSDQPNSKFYSAPARSMIAAKFLPDFFTR